MGCTRKNPADKMPWLEGEIRKCKEKRNEKDGSQTNDIWNTREPGMWSQCDGMLSACAGIFYRTLFRTGKRRWMISVRNTFIRQPWMPWLQRADRLPESFSLD